MRGLILSDGKPGHVNQSRSLSSLLGIEAAEVSIKYRSVLLEGLLRARLNLPGMLPSSLSDALSFLQGYITPVSLSALQASLAEKPDIVISTGTYVAAPNLVIARSTGARAVTILRPSEVPLEKFDLIILPEHDRRKKSEPNTIYIPITLSYFDENTRNEAESELKNRFGDNVLEARPVALIIGGNSPYFLMKPGQIGELAEICLTWSEKSGRGMVGTTSRRTPKEVEALLERKFRSESGRNSHWVWGRTDAFNPLPALLPRSSAVVVTEDSISMINEAILNGKYPIVVELVKRRKSRKLLRFRNSLVERGLARWVKITGVTDELDSGRQELSPSQKIDIEGILDEIRGKLGI